MASKGVQESNLYTLAVSTCNNLTDPFECRIDGDVTRFQVPYSLDLDCILDIVSAEIIKSYSI